MRSVDLNCDLGESFGAWRMGDDQAVLPWITSANVACGFHAGDPRVMDWVVGQARELKVAVGAHPSFPDLVGFGRRNMSISYEEAFTDVLYQMGALSAFCQRHGVTLQHVKPHGQLNNLAMEDSGLANAIVDAVHAFNPGLILVSYGGELASAAKAKGLRVAVEAYADRAYHQDGRLVSRRVAGAVLHDADQVVDRAVSMVLNHTIPTIEGGELEVEPHTLCVHGDTPGAAELAQRLHQGLERAGVAVRPLQEVLHDCASGR